MRLPLLLVLLTAAVAAAPVEFSVIATVTQVDPLLGASFSAGQTVTGRYQFESTTPDSAIDPASGVYFNAGLLFTATLGSFAFTGSAVNITVSDLSNTDIYRVEGSSATGPNVGSFVISSLVLALTDNTLPASALANDALPLLPPALVGFDIRTLTLTFVDGARVASVVARVDVLVEANVPEPALALPLAGILAGLRRRR